jgi:hypothetical protein
MEVTYLRDDIYYCSGCGEFFDDLTNKLVDVPYSEMPADFALEVMKVRQRQFRICHIKRRSAQPRRKPKGFAK